MKLFILLLLSSFILVSPLLAAEEETLQDLNEDTYETEYDEFEEEEYEVIPDPLGPMNRLFFTFNDRLYFWALKPAAQGYSTVVGEEGRIGISNIFYNLLFPVRFVNDLLQGKFKIASNEVARFGVNTTFGFFGFHDIARDYLDIERHDEDLGLTLGSYGVGNGFYIVWPFLGPSSLRDTVGLVGDSFLDPLSVISPLVTKGSLGLVIAIRSYEAINDTSLRIGEYEDLKKAAIDPYVALQDAYYQYREDQIKK